MSEEKSKMMAKVKRHCKKSLLEVGDSLCWRHTHTHTYVLVFGQTKHRFCFIDQWHREKNYILKNGFEYAARVVDAGTNAISDRASGRVEGAISIAFRANATNTSSSTTNATTIDNSLATAHYWPENAIWHGHQFRAHSRIGTLRVGSNVQIKTKWAYKWIIRVFPHFLIRLNLFCASEKWSMLENGVVITWLGLI